MASRIGELEARSIAGMIILIAGRAHRIGPLPYPQAMKSKSIYIGVGELDPNSYPSRLAREWYERHGARVTFELFPGIGHQMPEHATLLRDWLEANGPLQHPGREEITKAEMKSWYRDRVDAILKEQDVYQSYVLARTLLYNPKIGLCGERAVQRLNAHLRKLSTRSPLKEEREAEQAYRDLMWQDAKIKTLDDIERVLSGFESLHERLPNTGFGALAEGEIDRLTKMLNSSRTATADAQAQFNQHKTQELPTRNRSVRRPVWDGNRLRFE